jgi:4-hydroxybenzoate polyprenyltransferase
MKGKIGTVPVLHIVPTVYFAGTWLLLWPCGWSLALATPAGCLPDPALLAVFGLGAFVMRGAGCTINDMWDRNIDHAVERTRERPITSGQVGPEFSFS